MLYYITLKDLRGKKSNRIMEKNDIQTETEDQEIVRNDNDVENISHISKELFTRSPQSENSFVQFFYNFVHALFIALSKIKFGQIMISALDYFMVKFENTLDFCSADSFDFADQEIIDRQQQLTVRDRPMTWLLFIPTLIFLRIICFTMSVYCIIFGKDAISPLQIKSKIIDFRRYYRSIQHYAVDKWTENEKKFIEERKRSTLWKFYYQVYEYVFMTEHEHDDNDEKPVDKANEQKKRNRNKRSLNISDEKEDLNSSSSFSSNSDNELNAMELIDKYGELNSSCDPDYKPDINSTFDSSITDEETEKTESQNELNDDKSKATVETKSDAATEEDIKHNEIEDKSNDFISLSPEQMSRLQTEIITKILNYLKENPNFASNTNNNTPEIFYSPIDSPNGNVECSANHQGA
ncbi:hypothetical protein PVAND_008937 [Polypedilum vanderplanki]|uniref:Uncharacterized protein n=1 Tax=Polypedilum vanderplanki TaxID=319348 RepID=A0A9J6CBX4_POLVA|nr:hypothetical protein PVAND_008937 [Polypedilum vanderplanki]